MTVQGYFGLALIAVVVVGVVVPLSIGVWLMAIEDMRDLLNKRKGRDE